MMFLNHAARRLGTLALALGVIATAFACGTPEETDDRAPEPEYLEAEPAGGPIVVELNETAFRTAGIEVATVAVAHGDVAGAAVTAPGRVAFDPSRVAVVSPRVAGRLERLAVVEGDAVPAGSAVAWLLSSDFLTAQSDYLQALRRAEALEATADAAAAQAVAAAARQRLLLLGATEAHADSLATGGATLDLLPVLAPFAGTIVGAHVRAGEALLAGTPIYTLADLSRMDVIAAVPERQLSAVVSGARGIVRLVAYPDRPLEGRVVRVRSEVDPGTRTVDVILRLDNRAGILRDGMFASVTLLEGRDAAAHDPVIVVPAAAVLWNGPEAFVFVQVGDRTFERRPVVLGSETGALPGLLPVRGGLAPGETVVIAGAFALKAELAKASFADEH